MTARVEKTATIAEPFASDEARWQAVVARDSAADGHFYYSVRTTGVFCKPSCAARLALLKNVRFHVTCQDAEAAGFRPCKRCKPTEASLTERHASVIARACRMIEAAEEVPSLDELASSVGMSRYHFHRTFKEQTGLTPKGYATAHRARTRSRTTRKEFNSDPGNLWSRFQLQQSVL